MTKRPTKIIAEEGKEFNSEAAERPNLSAEDFAFLDEADKLIVRVSTLAELLLVIDLKALKNPGMDYHEDVSFALREFGEVLSSMAFQASETLERGKNALGLD
jgi:hypothetical protein